MVEKPLEDKKRRDGFGNEMTNEYYTVGIKKNKKKKESEE